MGVISSGTAVQPEVDDARETERYEHLRQSQQQQARAGETRAEASHAAQPANSSSSSSDSPSTREQTGTLPTSRTTHPDVQAGHLNAIKEDGSEGDKAIVGRELEKAEADRRAVRGDEPKGTVVEGLEDGKSGSGARWR